MKLLTIWGHRKELYTVQSPELLEAVVDEGYESERTVMQQKLEEFRKYQDFSAVEIIELELGEGAEDAIMDALYPTIRTVVAHVPR